MDDAFVARKSLVRMIALVAGSFAFVVAGLWIAGLLGDEPDPARAWAGWLAIVVFGAFGLLGITRLFGPRDQLRVDANGIHWPQWSEATIPWSAIESAAVRSTRGQTFVCLHLHDPARYPSSRALGRLAGINRGMGFGDIAISTIGTDRRTEDLVGAIDRYMPRV